MPINVNPTLPVVATQGATSDVALQPGSTIAGRVLSVTPDNQARIAIGHSTIEVKSEVPLQAGQVMQFAVSKTDDGNVRLAILTPQTSGSGQAQGTSAGNGTLAPDLPVNLANAIATSKISLTSLQAQAVSTATQAAVTQQASLATLFADLGAVTALQGLPPQLQQAVAQVLAQRPPLDTQLTGSEVKSAFQASGLFLEASLAQGTLAQGGTLPQGTVPDMKAALIVLRQALSTVLASNAGQANGGATAPATTEQAASTLATVTPNVLVPATTQQAQNAAAAAVLVPSLLPKIKNDPVQPSEPVADDVSAPDAPVQAAAAVAKAVDATARSGGANVMMSMLQEALQANPKGLAAMTAQMLGEEVMTGGLLSAKAATAQAASDATPVRSNVPPPPLRGALPSAQPMLPSTLPANASLGTVAKHLLTETDAALARQTLLQVASLPDRADATTSQRLDQAAPRWSFEIPFAVPTGTAMAQFEISRDGGNGSEADAAQRVWRARFSLDVEPAGPVHALVSLTGDKTSVRMWAERAATARQLQDGAAQLSQALVRAQLQPGDIVVREGAPVQAAPASAGHFLDRAS